MFKVVLNDGQTPMPDDDIYYIIGKEGVYLKKKLGIMESIAPVKNISILQSVASSAQMHIEPIPGKWIAKVISFFKAVYDEYRSEAIVLLFYNEETGHHKIIPPHQKVAGASCDYDKGLTIDGYTMIGTIHSHGSMSAFHSGVDDSDEEHFDGLHITLGNLNDEHPSVSISIVSNGFRQMVEPSDYITDIKLVEEINSVANRPIRTVYKWIDGKLQKDEIASNKYMYGNYSKKFDRRYDVIVSDHDRVFNKKWMNMVEKGRYTYKSYRSGGYAGMYGYGAHGYGWGGHFDRNAWRQSGRTLPEVVKPTGKIPPQNVGQSAFIKPLEFPPHTQEGEFIPCATCEHRLCKITSEIEEEDFEEYYYCKQCGELVVEEEDTVLQCLTCLTDEHLILLDKDEVLTNNYTPSDIYDHMFEKDSTKVIEESSYISCKTCGSKFHVHDKDTFCPFCYSSIQESSEDDLIEREKKDSGYFLDDEAAAANAILLESAEKEDEAIERIPEPNSDSIPLSRKKDSILKSMFKQVFGNKGDA